MCYTVLLSTDCDDDLASFNTDRLRLESEIPTHVQGFEMKYRWRWHVGSKSGCGCTFRHLSEPELGFGPPVDWFHEEDDEIKGTAEFFKVVRTLVTSGHKVETVDLWNPGEEGRDSVEEKEISVSGIADEDFRFFDGFRFLFRP